MAPILSFSLALIAAISPVYSQWTVGQEVKTTSGTAKGHAASSQKDVSEYLGIRFGETTDKENRFLPPKKYTGTGPIDATKFGAACPFAIAGLAAAAGGSAGSSLLGSVGQSIGSSLGSAMGSLASKLAGPMSEDCLFANVWTKPQTGEKKKAVMLWIFGGGFSLGDASTPMYNGANLAANQDVVVVSFNYRTNMFGFPGAPGVKDQNPALLDQRLAVEWTRDNVAAFGGDPDRITLFGESAGGSSVDYYAFTWAKDPIINAMITQSGTAMMSGPFAPLPIEERHKAWYATTEKLGCGGQSAGPEATLKCAQTKSTKEIQDAMPQATGFKATVGYFGPTVDERTLFSDVYARAKAGKFIQKPLLTGSNQNESTIFTRMGGSGPEVEVALNNGFRCGTAEGAKARFLNKIPVWRYHFAGTKLGQTAGATHGQDIPLVFGDGKAGLGKLLQTAWASFAKDPLHALDKLSWPRYNPEGKTLIRFGFNDAVEPDFIQADTYDKTCPTNNI